jgi:hypothetical protein
LNRLLVWRFAGLLALLLLLLLLNSLQPLHRLRRTGWEAGAIREAIWRRLRLRLFVFVLLGGGGRFGAWLRIC